MFALGANGAFGGYNLKRSLRVRGAASGHLTRTGAASPTDYRKFTFSFLMKRGALSAAQRIVDSTASGLTGVIGLSANDELVFGTISGGAYTGYLQTRNLLRDPSASYHILLSCDTSVSSNQFKFYVNGVEASYSTNSSTLLNYGVGINGGSESFYIGRSPVYGLNFDGYFSEFNFIDGQTLTPSSFGEYDTTTGVWKPKKYSGTYGTNGFYLNFEDNSGATATTIGKDSSGNGNNWTPNNISVTAGATYDSMTDVPTLTDATTANYCVLNRLSYGTNCSPTSMVATNGNLNWNYDRSAAGATWMPGTIQIPANSKAYFEFSQTSFNTALGAEFGICHTNVSPSSTNPTIWRTIAAFNGNRNSNTGSVAYGTSFAVNDICGVAVDMVNGRIFFSKNGVWQGSGDPVAGTNAAFTDLVSSGYNWLPLVNGSGGDSNAGWANFGQRPFAYTPPTGFVALNAYNLPDATIKKGSDNFDVVLDTGANIKTTTEALYPSNFFEWIKDRANANNHQLIDIVRGATAVLQSNTSAAETTYSAPSGNSVGFAWKAGGAAVSNTAGSITSSVSANASAGFSIVTYTGNGTSGATVGHGLGVAPKMIVIKARSSGVSWIVWHSALGANNYLILNSTNAVTSTVNFGSVTSTTFNLNGGSGFNGSGTTYVAYCFAEIDAFSKFGSYVGTSNADGPFIYLPFRPKLVIWKPTTFAGNWFMSDSVVNPYNVGGAGTRPNATTAEAAVGTGTNAVDFLSNGFKIRNNAGTEGLNNSSGQTYIFAAFAENPFKNSLAR